MALTNKLREYYNVLRNLFSTVSPLSFLIYFPLTEKKT